MTSPLLISFDDADPLLQWKDISQAIEDGHGLSKAELSDTFLRSDNNTLLNRSAWIDPLGVAVKAATVFPDLKPSIHGGVLVFSPDNGELEAVIDFHLVTKWKTAADSLLGAMKLARADSQKLLIVGAGTVAENLCNAYRSHWPNIEISIWNRTEARAQSLAKKLDLKHASDLETAVSSADIVSSATMTSTPIFDGTWFRPGQHIDLIGAYRPDMREVDDHTLSRSRIFVDSKDTTIDHIGELKDPLARGAIEHSDVLADFYDISNGLFKRDTQEDITLFKNGGGAHLDLMVSRAILTRMAQG